MPRLDPYNSIGITRQRLIAIALLIAAAGIIFALAIHAMNDQTKIDVGEEDIQDLYKEDINLIRYSGKWYKQDPDQELTLMIGVDVESEDTERPRQADFLLLVAMDKKKNSYKALQINRDTMADVPQLDVFEEEYGTQNQQIALAYTHGNNEAVNCKNTVKAVSNLLYGLDIDHYVSVTMNVVPIVNDMVGGVPVFVEDDFSNADPDIKQGTTVLLRGSQALTFVRARKDMEEPTNMARMERQRVYMHALEKQAMEKFKADEDFVLDSLFELASYFTSDCTIYQMSDMLNIVLSAQPADIFTTKGEAKADSGYMEYYVDEEALQKQIVDLFFVEDTERN